ncbi:hypothetical protein AACH10_05730 [Ideonella sp. DXS22W]|uniref:DUF3592 domain-containing protein n=1 Tax=Pseudaquabacterium inlustre TaxID=2984192 RepID=A0ABU9CGM0_9BURK
MTERKRLFSAGPVGVLAALYLLLFGGLGLYLQVWWWQGASLAWQARDWQPQAAQLDSWSLTSLRSPWLGNHPRPATSHGLQARFSYQVDGRTHTSTQVFVVSLVDSTSDRDRDRAIAQLREAQAAGGGVTLWRDPLRPERAVLVRELPAAFAAGVIAFMVFPCGPATATWLGWGMAALARLGLAGAEHWTGRLWALWHGAMAAVSLLLIAPWARQGLAAAVLAGLALLLCGHPLWTLTARWRRRSG